MRLPFFILGLCLVLSTVRVPSLQADEMGADLNPEIKYTLPSRATFVVPMGWEVKAKDGAFILKDPDRQMTLYIMESDENDGQDAILTSWKKVVPDFSYATGQVRHYPKNDNKWDEAYRVWFYVPSLENPRKADEKRGLYAIAKKKQGHWYVGLLDFDRADADKRASQTETILATLEVYNDKPTPTPGSSSLDAAFIKSFEDFIEQARDRCKVPGAALAIVSDGKVIEEKGFGVRDLDTKAPVTPKTIFSIASMTKPLTSLLMARLVDAGILSWGTPVTQLLPTFALGDPDRTAQLTLQNTVCACTGMPRQDMEMIFSAGYASPEDLIHKMWSMVPTTGYGETFQYSNLMVAAGGYAAAHVVHPDLSLGPAYQAAMQDQVFGPLGMNDTTLDFDAVHKAEYASPHCYKLDYDFKTVPLSENYWIVPAAPAAGVWSTVEDLSKYLCLEMSGGLGPDGKRVVSEANLLKRRIPQARMSEGSFYGLGLIIEDDKGVKVVGHGGNAIGYTSDMFFLPERKIGVVLLTNADQANGFRSFVRERFMELLTGREAHAQENLDKEISYRRERGKFLSDWVDYQAAQSWVYDFAGDYLNEDLGPLNLKMTQEGGMLTTSRGKYHVSGFKSRDGQTYLYIVDPPFAWMELVLKDQDGHKTMTLKTPQLDYVFEPVSKGKN